MGGEPDTTGGMLRPMNLVSMLWIVRFEGLEDSAVESFAYQLDILELLCYICTSHVCGSIFATKATIRRESDQIIKGAMYQYLLAICTLDSQPDHTFFIL